VLSQAGPGGDVLVAGQGVLGWTWVLGAAGMTGLAAFAPRSLFLDTAPAAAPAAEPGA
jgi:hypothetical protein